MKDIKGNKKYGNQFAYVLDCIFVCDNEGNEIEASDKKKVNYFFECYESEYNYPNNKRLYPREQDRIANYLRGLPSCCSVAFEDYKIIEIGKEWGFCKTAKQESDFVNRWFDVIAFRLIQLKKHFNL